MQRHRDALRTGWHLAVLALCVVFTVGFILFEVLDLDGSDFPVKPANVAVRVAEAPRNDERRAMLAPAPDASPMVESQPWARVDARAVLARDDARRVVDRAVRCVHRIALPRASLADVTLPA